MSISLDQHIKNLRKKDKEFDGAIKTLALEITGQFKDNIGKDRITPKTKNNKSGKTLVGETKLGQKSILTLIKGAKLATGSFLAYMGHHLTGTKYLPIRNWLKTPKDLQKIVKAWIRNWMKN